MKFRCNSTTEASNSSHTEPSSRISTLEAVDSYSSSITSGVVNITTDITNGALASKVYYCPICHEKLIWEKKYIADGNNLGSAVGTFTMLNDDGETEATITDQVGVDDNIEDDDAEVIVIPEYGQPRYEYNQTEWISETESEEQKKSISWKDPSTGYTYYGTKAMNNLEKGVAEAHRKYTFKELQTKNLANALMKLRMNKEVSIAAWGDSVFAGFFYLSDENAGKYEGEYEEDVFTDDYGVEYSGFDACKNRIPEVMVKTLNTVYDNKITLLRRVWNAITVSNEKKPDGKPVDYSIFSHWKASKADISVMNFGINDSIGGHIPTSYLGKVDMFIDGYKALIERELENGTAVVLVSPFKQSTIGIVNDLKADLDDRTIIDVYEQAIYSIAQEYGIPFVDGQLMVKNFDSSLFLDFSHFLPEGSESLGKRLASIFIGQNVLRPLQVHNNTYLSVFQQYSNCKLTGTANYSYSTTSPNIKSAVSIGSSWSDITKPEGAIECVLKADGDSILWSVYCPKDGMVVIPSFENKTTSAKVTMELDFGATQGAWANYWNFKEVTDSIDRDYKEPSTVIYESTDLTESRFGYHMLDSTHKKAIKIVGEGWHSIRISASGLSPEETIKVFGITFLDLRDYELITK